LKKEKTQSLVELHPIEVKILQALKSGKKLSIDDIEEKTKISRDSVSRASLWLASKNLVSIKEMEEKHVRLGSEGEKFLQTGLPERVLVESILKAGGKASYDQLSKLSGLKREEINIAISWAKKKGWLRVFKEGKNTVLEAKKPFKVGSDERVLELLSRSPFLLSDLSPTLIEGLNLLRRRPDVLIVSRKIERLVTLTDKGLKTVEKIRGSVAEVSQLTPELIQSGDWRAVKLRKYDLTAPVLKIWPGKKQPYKRFLDVLKEKLVSLGFKEMEGPLVELMFLNCDALYMPQDHPAREIHDMYLIKSPRYGDISAYKRVVKKVEATHENGWKTGSKGWGYEFSVQEAGRLILRSQGTALSVRALISKNLEIPGKYFSIARCYRPDVVDKNHLTEFNQVEGIILGKELTFRSLLGVLEKFAVEIAEADKFVFRPDYFPFTEPSVELSAYKEGYGWVEFGGAGIFRPEVTLPLGVSVPVIAWGLGVDRLFMMKADIDDIRTLFTQDLEWLREKKVV